jgi:hypothetical protein
MSLFRHLTISRGTGVPHVQQQFRGIWSRQKLVERQDAKTPRKSIAMNEHRGHCPKRSNARAAAFAGIRFSLGVLAFNPNPHH